MASLSRARSSTAGQENAFKPAKVKRSVSLGGAPLQMLAAGAGGLKRTNTDDSEVSLSPSKRIRRSLAPVRSILRKSLAGPVAFGDDTTQTLNLTQVVDGTLDQTDGDLRKSLSRRVSFAPTAHMREFSKDDHEEASSDADPSPPKQLPASASANNRRSSLARFEDAMDAETEEMSMEMADTSVTAAFDTHLFGRAPDGAAHLMDETQPDFGNDSTMELASADVTTAFAVNAAIQARPSLAPALARAFERGVEDEEAEQQPSSSSADEEVAASLGAVAHIEYNVPLGAPGIGPPSNGSDAIAADEDEQSMSASDEDATMEMSLDAGATGIIVEDGFTSRRLSVSGAVKRASLAPGHAALAMLEADEALDEDETMMQDELDQGATPSKPVASIAAQSSRIPLSAGRGRPPSSLALPSAEIMSRRTLGTPSPARPVANAKSPAKSPARPAPPPQPVFGPSPKAAKPEASAPKAEPAAVSLDGFLELAGVQFMEDVFANPKRKSIGTTLEENQALTTALKTRVTLKDQLVAAGVTLPTLDTYNGMTRELRASLQEAHGFLENVQEGIDNGDIPALFIEFQSATRGQRDLMTAHLRTSKNLFRTEVRSEWYDYRTQCLVRENGVIDGLQDNLKRLEADRIATRSANDDLSALLPKLRNREQFLQRELQQERGRMIELENCDQEHLGSLREGVMEQSLQLEEQMREQNEVEQELARLDAKLAEIDARRIEATVAIGRAKQTANTVRCFTFAEVQRLKSDLESMEELHSWQVIEFTDSEVKLVHRGEFGIALAFDQNGVVVSELAFVDDVSHPRDDWLRALLQEFVQRIHDSLSTAALPRVAAHLLRTLANQWNAVRRIAAEATLLQLRYPTSVHRVFRKGRDSTPALRLSARVFCRSAGAAFDVRFDIMDEDVLAGDEDVAVESVVCAIEPRFGQIDDKELAYIVRDRVSRGGRGALVEATTEAEQKYA